MLPPLSHSTSLGSVSHHPTKMSMLSRNKTWADVVRNFTPAWFAVNMGTGAISILFHAFPYGNGSSAMNILTLIFFGLNVFLFLIFTAISTARYMLFPGIWSLMIHHPVQSLFLGTFPMGAATILNVAVLCVYEQNGVGGKPLLYFLWACWWLDVLTSIAICFLMIHVMTTAQNHALEKMTAVWLLPVVTLIVASSSGGVIAPSLYAHSASHALITLTLSGVLVAIGLTLALMMLAIYLLRLIVHGLPPTATVISVFLPLGPTGQAAFSILLIGQCFDKFLPVYGGASDLLRLSTTGATLNTICTVIAFVLWSMCTMWTLFAFLSIQNVLRKGPIPFKVPFWGLIFPNGVYANITISLGETFDSGFFRVWGAMYAALTLCMWCYVAFTTIGMVFTKEIFEAPCLEDVDTRRLGRKPATTPCGRALDEQGLPVTPARTSAEVEAQQSSATVYDTPATLSNLDLRLSTVEKAHVAGSS
ncbi:voltage-dependent anion channel-domain-containing protein [Schizophyllum amplum]|uniref:Voltage-dependent anion channel-domain-containing protein n=1 Tax=Schizophyllum amplum TaxID=97359 RepID=A0A550CY72_9AGAR|nr:voltage-dependent anion channel-domain-containing protein [Auriculariopsis ampla]